MYSFEVILVSMKYVMHVLYIHNYCLGRGRYGVRMLSSDVSKYEGLWFAQGIFALRVVYTFCPENFFWTRFLLF